MSSYVLNRILYAWPVGMITYRLLVLFAFVIPLNPKLVTPVAGLFVLHWLLTARFLKLKSLLQTRERSYFLMLILLWFFMVVSLFYTDNMAEGLFKIEVRMSLILMPLILGSSGLENFSMKQRNNVLYAFVAGLLCSSVYYLYVAFTLSLTGFDISHWLYTGFSFLYHPSYYSAYIILACSIMFILHQQKKPVFVVLLISFFSVILVLTNAKSGAVSLLLFLIMAFLYNIFMRISLWRLLLLLAFPLILFVSGFFLIPSATLRIQETAESVAILSGSKPSPHGGYPSSTGMRVKLWESSVQVIKENPLYGVGVGDAQDVLDSVYEDQLITLAYQNHLNSHNQFLQTAVAAGIPAMIVLILLLLLPFIDSIRYKLWLPGFFLALCALNFMFESILERQEGVVFFTFFYMILLIHKHEENIELYDGF